jgi:hypothetical protein
MLWSDRKSAWGLVMAEKKHGNYEIARAIALVMGEKTQVQGGGE